MDEREKARQAFLTLKQAESADAQTALPLLNGLIGLVQGGGGEQSIEVDEARAAAFMAICEVGKSLHRGQPNGPLWVKAIQATETWMSLSK